MPASVQTEQLNKRQDDSPSRARLHPYSLLVSWNQVAAAVLLALLLPAVQALAENLMFESVQLPALQVNGRLAKAHTQGLEVVADDFYVTVRRDDVLPKQALLLRTGAGRTDWDVWDITPVSAGDAVTVLDHPGGFQSDGKRLWIPLAESKRKGRSIIRVFPLAGMALRRPLKAEFEFPVNDHIGAVAVFVDKGLVLGASWDTEAVYVWDLLGRLQQTLDGSELQSRGLGVVGGPKGRTGLAVQDWKIVNDRLFASGLLRVSANASLPQSQLLSFVGFLEREFHQQSFALPKAHEAEVAREGMAISEGRIYFLPEDLGASNRILRASLADLMKRGTSLTSPFSPTP